LGIRGDQIMAAVPEDDLPSSLRGTSVPKDDLPVSSVPSLQEPAKPKPPSLMERGREFIGAGTTGAALGAIAPELTIGAGMAASMFPGGAAVGVPLMAAGNVMRGARLASTGAGLLSGVAGEAAAQGTELMGGGKTAQEGARLVSEIVAPESGRFLSRIAGRTAPTGYVQDATTAARSVLMPSGSAESIARQAAAERLQAKMRKSRELVGEGDQARVYRRDRDVTDVSAQTRIYDQARQNIIAQQQKLQADFQSAASNANNVAQQIKSAAEQQVGRLQSQFEAAMIKLEKAQQESSDLALANAQNEANRILAEARNQEPVLRQAAQKRADEIISQGQKDAELIFNEAKQTAARLREVASRARQTGEQRVTQARGGLGQVGQPANVADVGAEARNLIDTRLKTLREQRKTAADANMDSAFAEAEAKERAGLRIKQTEAFQSGVGLINDILRNPDTKMSNVNLPQIRDQLNRVKSAITGRTVADDGSVVDREVSFRSLEYLRRFLGDRASGLPAEGFDAIGQQQAGKLKEIVENIQREFVEGFGKALDQYEVDSQPISQFKSKFGKAITGREDYDFSKFSTFAADLPAQIFKNRDTVDEAIALSGGNAQQLEKLARQFVSDQIQQKNGKQIADFLFENRGWLERFPQLRQDINTFASTLGTAESVAGRRERLASALGTQIGSLRKTAAKEVKDVREKAQELAGQQVPQAEKEAGLALEAAKKLATSRLEVGQTEAQKLADALEAQRVASASKVEGQRKAIMSEAEKRANAAMPEAVATPEQAVQKVLGTDNPAQTIESMLTGSKSIEETRRLASYLGTDRRTKLDFLSALEMTLSRVTPEKLKDVFERNVIPALEGSALVGAKDIDQLRRQVQVINRVVDPDRRVEAAARIFRAIAAGSAGGIAAQPVGSLLGGGNAP
jgi:hypothetical protein